MPRPPTMTDIAERAGVSRVAVSYALNDRPGVSEELRERIKGIAAELGFRANVAAQAIHGAAAHAVGLALRRPTAELSAEVFRRQLISGVQLALAARGDGLALQFVDSLAQEAEVYRRWSAESRVDGVILCDQELDDPRPAVLAAVGLPAVILGPPPEPAGPFSYAWSDERVAAGELVAYLKGLGHRHFSRISGPAAMLHTRRRTEALDAAGARLGLTQTVLPCDYTGISGARLTRRILGSRARPTALVYDNDLMAVAGLGVAGEMGIRVPADVSILAWEDSPLCQVVRPAISVLQRDIAAYGTAGTRALLRTIDEKAPQRVLTAAAQLIVRDSTGPAAG